MNILQLPEEILLIICKNLSVKDKLSIYNTCSLLRKVVVSRSINKCCELSLNTLATCRTLKFTFIKDTSLFIEELDMSGVYDLAKSNFLPCLNRMKNLKTLNIAYTNIIIPDLIDLKLGIKSITINFSFSRNKSPKISQATLDSCQNYFKDFESVHFVGAVENLIHSRLPIYILSKTCDTISVKFTALNHFNGAIYENVECDDSFKFQFLSINFPHWRDNSIFYYDYLFPETNSNFHLLNMKNLKFIIILKSMEDKVFVSEGFRDFFLHNFNVETESISELVHVKFRSNSLFYFWDKDHVKFDKGFFNKLKLKIKDFFPSCLRYDTEIVLKNEHTSWYFIKPSSKVSSVPKNNDGPPHFKKRRVAPGPLVLDYDHIFSKDETIQLKLNFDPNITLLRIFTLSPHSNYLQKISVLSIVGHYMLSRDFFQILFKYCANLVTLNIGYSPKCSCNLLISQSIYFSKTLKNFRLVENRIDFKSLLEALSRCPTLENIHIVELSSINGCNIAEEDFGSLIAYCSNLYSIFIHAFISDNMRIKLMRSITKLKQRYGRNYLNAVININKNMTTDSYNPYISVYPISQIKD